MHEGGVTDEGPSLVRDGDLIVRLLDGEGRESDASLHDFLARKFGAVFAPEVCFYGLTAPTGHVAGEAAGFALPVKDLAQQRLQALGEARIKVTPLGLAEAYRRLARERAENGTRQALLAPVYAGLEASTLFGVGRWAAPHGLAVAGKTGTAAAAEGPWTHAWFAGYAPADRPEIVLVVFLERGRGGGDAAPLARQIFAAWSAWRERS